MAGQAGIPPLGERDADAITAGHGAIEVIDEILAELTSLRQQLITELRADEDARAARVDAMLPLIPASEIDAEVAARFTTPPGPATSGASWTARPT
ncbi:MAG: hypothetical protein ABSB01_03460 [Streptosporangiaceae bacterium]